MISINKKRLMQKSLIRTLALFVCLFLMIFFTAKDYEVLLLITTVIVVDTIRLVLTTLKK